MELTVYIGRVGGGCRSSQGCGLGMEGQHEHQRPEHLVRPEELRSHLLFSDMDVLPKESKGDIKHSGLGAANLSSNLSFLSCVV